MLWIGLKLLVFTNLVDFQPLMKLIKKEKPYIVGLLEESSAERFAADCAFLTRLHPRRT